METRTRSGRRLRSQVTTAPPTCKPQSSLRSQSTPNLTRAGVCTLVLASSKMHSVGDGVAPELNPARGFPAERVQARARGGPGCVGGGGLVGGGGGGIGRRRS